MAKNLASENDDKFYQENTKSSLKNDITIYIAICHGQFGEFLLDRTVDECANRPFSLVHFVFPIQIMCYSSGGLFIKKSACRHIHYYDFSPRLSVYSSASMASFKNVYSKLVSFFFIHSFIYLFIYFFFV